jgi:hypothetical protein
MFVLCVMDHHARAVAVNSVYMYFFLIFLSIIVTEVLFSWECIYYYYLF